ncbi:MAG: sigma 54-interacting transcriptional regulator [Peptococcaceae bacterium]|nr:sigma 54-interacting transcriptional regulator [Peptococcaceae bacterium]
MEVENHVFEVDDLILSKNLQVILDLLDECIMIVDKQGKIIFYNQANEKLDNLKREDIIGRHLTECFNIVEHTSATLQVLSKKKPVVDLFQDYSTLSGNRTISVSSSYPLVHDGEFMGALTITKNIYQFKKLMDIISNAEKPIKFYSADNNYTFEQIIGESRALMNCIHIARKAAKTNSSVLIYGDTGTGKEFFAQSVHNASGRKGPFISLNCAAIPETLLESILFGTAKGAFTGAIERQGLFEEATNGTLFLDEINSMNSNQQAKLLRVLETGRIRKVGENKEREINVRVLSALNISPIKAVEQGILRQDLFYRLSVINICIPPLKEHKEDIPLLTKFFINHYNNLINCKVRAVSSEVAELFMQYDWPGNVRELRHVIEYAMNMVEDEEIINREHLSALFNEQINQDHPDDKILSFAMASNNLKTGTLKTIIEDVERETIQEVLREVNGNVNEAARRMGLSRQNLDYKLKKYLMQKT